MGCTGDVWTLPPPPLSEGICGCAGVSTAMTPTAQRRANVGRGTRLRTPIRSHPDFSRGQPEGSILVTCSRVSPGS